MGWWHGRSLLPWAATLLIRPTGHPARPYFLVAVIKRNLPKLSCKFGATMGSKQKRFVQPIDSLGSWIAGCPGSYSRLMFLYRDEKFMLPEADSRLRRGDEVMVITHSRNIEKLHQRLSA